MIDELVSNNSINKIRVPYKEFFIHEKNLIRAALKPLREADIEFNENLKFLEGYRIRDYPIENLINDHPIINQLSNETINLDCFGRPNKESITEMENKGLKIEELLIPKKYDVALYRTSFNEQLIQMGKLVNEAEKINCTDYELVSAFALTEPSVAERVNFYFLNTICAYKESCLFLKSGKQFIKSLFPVDETLFFNQRIGGYLLTLREYLSIVDNKHNKSKTENLSNKLLKGVPDETDEHMNKLIKNYHQPNLPVIIK